MSRLQRNRDRVGSTDPLRDVVAGALSGASEGGLAAAQWGEAAPTLTEPLGGAKGQPSASKAADLRIREAGLRR